MGELGLCVKGGDDVRGEQQDAARGRRSTQAHLGTFGACDWTETVTAKLAECVGTQTDIAPKLWKAKVYCERRSIQPHQARDRGTWGPAAELEVSQEGAGDEETTGKRQ